MDSESNLLEVSPKQKSDHSISDKYGNVPNNHLSSEDEFEPLIFKNANRNTPASNQKQKKSEIVRSSTPIRELTKVADISNLSGISNSSSSSKRCFKEESTKINNCLDGKYGNSSASATKKVLKEALTMPELHSYVERKKQEGKNENDIIYSLQNLRKCYLRRAN